MNSEEVCPRVLLNIPYISLTPLSIVDTRSCGLIEEEYYYDRLASSRNVCNFAGNILTVQVFSKIFTPGQKGDVSPVSYPLGALTKR